MIEHLIVTSDLHVHATTNRFGGHHDRRPRPVRGNVQSETQRARRLRLGVCASRPRLFGDDPRIPIVIRPNPRRSRANSSDSRASNSRATNSGVIRISKAGLAAAHARGSSNASWSEAHHSKYVKLQMSQPSPLAQPAQHPTGLSAAAPTCTRSADSDEPTSSAVGPPSCPSTSCTPRRE